MADDNAPPMHDASLVPSQISDHGFEAKEFRGMTYPLGDHAPEIGEIYPLAPGIGWTRLPVPGGLQHINIWLLDDRDEQGDGIAIVDTGLNMGESREAWKKLFAGPLKGKRITRVFVTHFHPDHVGGAGWLCHKNNVRLWMNRTEWLMARMLTSDIRDEPPQEALDQMIFAGWENERIEALRAKGWGNFARMVSRVPISHVRMAEGDVIPIGDRNWRVLTGGGHTPEHSCLVDEENGVIIAGDQILPRITSNVSIMTSEPTANPLGEWLDSIEKFRGVLDAKCFVLPAHGFPFRGVHERLDALSTGHHKQLDALAGFVAEEPRRAVDCFSLLFGRKIGDRDFGLATGEALAHLRYLEEDGRAKCETKNGVGWFGAA